jgi:hypothetical protein
MKISRLNIILIIIGLITLGAGVGYSTHLNSKVSYNPEIEVVESIPTNLHLEKSNELSECQHYYTHVFPNAPEFGTFVEYSVTGRYTGTIAEVDLKSHAVAKRFYTHHKNALEKGVNFAGKYVISEWDFTNMGLMFAVIDAETGQVYPFPYVVDWDYDFRIDSNLIIINPKDTMPTFSSGGDIDCGAKWYSNMKSYYFLFEDEEFKLLGPEEGFDLITSDWLDDE